MPTVYGRFPSRRPKRQPQPSNPAPMKATTPAGRTVSAQAVADATVKAVVETYLPTRDRAMAQYGADYAVAELGKRGLLKADAKPEPLQIEIVGMPDRLKGIKRDAEDKIIGVIEYDDDAA